MIRQYITKDFFLSGGGADDKLSLVNFYNKEGVNFEEDAHYVKFGIQERKKRKPDDNSFSVKKKQLQGTTTSLSFSFLDAPALLL